MALKIRKASEIQYPVRLLIYGDSGAGKTHLAMLADLVEGMHPALLVPCDGGESTARALDIAVVEYEGAKTVQAVVRAVTQNRDAFNTVIIDGFSMYYDQLVYQHSSGDVPGIQHWMRAASDVKLMMQKFVKLRTNIIVTCLAQKLQEESSGMFFTVPLLPGKMAWRFAEAFDITGHLSSKARQKKVSRFLQVQPYRRIVAKDRGGTLGVPELDVTWALGTTDKTNPMEYVWKSWTAHQTGKVPPPMELGVPDEDDIELYEKGGDETTELS